jgi:hypothetical protein
VSKIEEREVCVIQKYKSCSLTGRNQKSRTASVLFVRRIPSILLIVKTRPNVDWNTESHRWSFFRSLFLRAVRARETHVCFFSHPFRDTLLIARYYEGVFERVSAEDDRRWSDFSAGTRVQRLFAVDRPRVCRRTLLADGFPQRWVSRSATGRSNALGRVDKLSMLYRKLSSLSFVGYFTHANAKIDVFRVISRQLDSWTRQLGCPIWIKRTRFSLAVVRIFSRRRAGVHVWRIADDLRELARAIDRASLRIQCARLYPYK